MKLWFCVLFSKGCCILFAQTPADSLYRADSAQMTQNVTILQQQQKIDSLVKLQLEKQLNQSVANSWEYDSLKIKLKELAVTDSARKAEQLAHIDELRRTAKG